MKRIFAMVLGNKNTDRRHPDWVARLLLVALFSPVFSASAITLYVEKRMPNGGESLGPFSIAVTCKDANGNDYVHYQADLNENTASPAFFNYPDATAIDCSVSETLTNAQQPYFDVTLGDTYRTNNGRMLANDSNSVDGETFYVVNDYTPPVTINVEKRTPAGDGGRGPFDIEVNCDNGDSHSFTLNGGESASFTYPPNTAIDCSVSETLGPGQDGYFDVRLGDTYNSDNGRMAANNSNSVDGETFYVENTYINPVTIHVEKITPNGDGGLGPFNVRVSCKNGDVHDFQLNGGDSASFNYPSGQPIDCRVSETLTAAQEDFFKVKKGDDFGPSNGRMWASNSDSVDGKTFTVTNIYVPQTVVNINVEKLTPNGDDGRGPFDVAINCANGDSYLFEMDGGDSDSFQYEAGSPIDCRVSETLRPNQDGFFKVKKGDDYGPNNGRMWASNSNVVDGKTFTVTNIFVPGGVIDINIEKITPNGDDGRGPFDLFVNCKNGDSYAFELFGGEGDSFQYEADSPIDCRVSETLRPNQDGFFKVKKGDNYGPNNGRMWASNSNSVDGHTFYVTNTFVPTGVININIEKLTPNGDDGRGPFDLYVNCANGERFEFLEMDGGEGDSFQYDANTPIDCRVSETLNANQDGFFKVKKGDDYGPDNGRMRANNSNSVDEHTYQVTNTFVPQGVVELDIVLFLEGDLAGLGPFNVVVSCSNGDEYTFEMDAGDVEHIQYHQNSSIDCQAAVLLTPEQQQAMIVQLGDNWGDPSDGRIAANDSNAVDGSQFQLTFLSVQRSVPTLGSLALLLLSVLLGGLAIRRKKHCR